MAARLPPDASTRFNLAAIPSREEAVPLRTFSDPKADALLPDDLAMRYAEWAYFNVEEVWTAFNLLAEAAARGFRVEAPTKKLQAELDAWNDAVGMQGVVRMWLKNALVYGRCVMEVSKDFLKVRNPRYVQLEQDEQGKLVAAWQATPTAARRAIPVERVRVFTLHSLVSDDLRGVSAVHPILQTIDDMLEARKVNRAVGKRLGTPVRVVELPPEAHEDEQHAMQAALGDTPVDADLVLPPGAKLSLLNESHGLTQLDEATREKLTDRILLGLGVPRIALGLPDGSNRSVGEIQRAMLLADKVAPYQRQVKEFAERLYGQLLGKQPTVSFDPVDMDDEAAAASVSKILVEAGIKTAKQVEERYWAWGST